MEVLSSLTPPDHLPRLHHPAAKAHCDHSFTGSQWKGEKTWSCNHRIEAINLRKFRDRLLPQLPFPPIVFGESLEILVG